MMKPNRSHFTCSSTVFARLLKLRSGFMFVGFQNCPYETCQQPGDPNRGADAFGDVATDAEIVYSLLQAVDGVDGRPPVVSPAADLPSNSGLLSSQLLQVGLSLDKVVVQR